MKVLFSWLKEYVDFDLSPDELAQRLTMAGLEVAGVEEMGEETILELEVTPNRGDCLSMVGVAREISALTGSPLRPPKTHLSESKEEISSLISISVEELKLCPRYTARIIKDVRVGPSPDWLKSRLLAAGIRSINNIVDITNYILLELGQPMHAFDYRLLKGNRLSIRLAEEGEQLITLDGIDRRLNREVLVIADRDYPVAIAGIMGGQATQVTFDTHDVLLEAAYFDPATVRRMSRGLGLSSESSYRFEREVDPEGLPLAQDRAVQLIKELAGGKIVQGMIDIYPEPIEKVTITLRGDRVNRVLGVNLTLGEMTSILEGLGFDSTIHNQDIAIVEVPSYRHEIIREIDLVEEIARIYGYEKISFALPHKTVLAVRRHIDEITKRTKEILVGLGLYEVITLSFIDHLTLTKLRLGEDRVKIANPLSEETSLMRTSLIPGLIKTVLWNINRGVNDIKIFELGRVFHPKEDRNLPDEKYSLAVALTGYYQKSNWRRKDEKISFYELAGIIERLMEGLGIEDYRLVKGEHPSFCAGRTAVIEIKGRTLGIMGEIDPDVTASFDLSTDLYLFEIDFDRLMALSNLERSYRPLPIYPAATRDLSILVKEEVQAEKILEIIKEVGGKLIEEVELFDLYPGEKLEEKCKGFKSLTYSIVYRDLKATLKDESVNHIHNQIVSVLEERLGAKLRGRIDY
ncbi:TPA: phenylalanine--tRNA ligase subunit beta [bacterium]|nr:phenylalanine--tRNA ligase subunit beta [bacterium]